MMGCLRKTRLPLFDCKTIARKILSAKLSELIENKEYLLIRNLKRFIDKLIC